MCGIIAVLRRPSSREVPDLVGLNNLLDSITSSLSMEDLNTLKKQVDSLDFVNSQLKGLPGFLALFHNEGLISQIERNLEDISEFLTNPTDLISFSSDDVEALNSSLTMMRDLVWSINNARIGSYKGVVDLV